MQLKQPLRIALAGQPNSGKTSLFNLLSGASQHVGNWPGVTVERKEGRARIHGVECVLIDLPGAYGLGTTTPDEAVTGGFLASGEYDLILNVVDSTNLERQLYLSIQLSQLGKPFMMALTMCDELAKRGASLDNCPLEEAFGCHAVAVSARKGTGIELLKEHISKGLWRDDREPFRFDGLGARGEALERALEAITRKGGVNRFGALRALAGDDAALLERIDDEAHVRFEEECGMPHAAATSEVLHRAAESIAAKAQKRAEEGDSGKGHILDRVFLSKTLGLPAFLAVMLAAFLATFSLGDLVSGWMEELIGMASEAASGIEPPFLASLLSDGVIGGVGNVLLLLPYVAFMFLIIGLLEDSGYMARAAYAMDGVMKRFGLHGKAFIPLLMGFGCNVPAIMAARTLERPRDRLKAILMIPFISCSARLPVYALFAGAFFGASGGFVVFGLYVLGIAAAFAMARLLTRRGDKEAAVGLVMELPPYRLPKAKNLMLNVWNKSKEYLHKAATVIFLMSIIIWALYYFPEGSDPSAGDNLIGAFGKFISPIFGPLGLAWPFAVALITGFVAKEVVISTLAILNPAFASLEAGLPLVLGPASALAFLVFVLLYTPCMATLVIMGKETKSLKWTLFSVGYSLALAWIVAYAVRMAAIAFGLAA
jgi:ferrous iron transport protein B